MIALAAHRHPNFAVRSSNTTRPCRRTASPAISQPSPWTVSRPRYSCSTRTCDIQFASAAARRLMEEGRLVIRNGQLGSPYDGETPALRRLIRQCVEVTSAVPGL